MEQEIVCGEEAHPSKTVLITGVSKGLGRALTLELAKRGHTIIGCSRNQNKLDLLRVELSNISSRNHLLVNLDVRSNNSVKEMASNVLEKMGAPDIIDIHMSVESCSEIPKEKFDDVIDTNIKGTTNVLRHFIPLLIAKNQGVIVNLSSIYGRTGVAQVSPYSCSNWAIEGVSKSVAKEVPDGIAVVSLDPGIINTDMLATHIAHSASKYQSPHECASKAASIILNITSADNGASITVDDLDILP